MTYLHFKPRGAWLSGVGRRGPAFQAGECGGQPRVQEVPGLQAELPHSSGRSTPQRTNYAHHVAGPAHVPGSFRDFAALALVGRPA